MDQPKNNQENKETDPIKNPKKHLYSRENKGQFNKSTSDEEYYKNWEDDRI